MDRREFQEGFRVRDALKLPCLEGAKVIAGEGGLDRELRSVTVLDAPPVFYFARGGELILSSSYCLSKEMGLQDHIIADLVEMGIAAFGIKMKRFLSTMPEAMIQQANELNFPLIELPYKLAWVDVISPVLSEILHSQSMILQISKDSHERLTKLVLAGGGLNDIMVELSSIIGRPAFIADRGWKCIASSAGKPANDEEFGPFNLSPDQIRKAWQTGSPLGNSLLPNSKLSDGLAIVPVTAGDRVYAYLLIPQEEGPLSATNLTVIENASTVCALEIVRKNAITEVERRFRNNFVEDLVLGNFESVQAITRRAASFDWNLASPQVVLNIDFDGFERYFAQQQEYNEKAVRDAKNRFVRIVESIPKKFNRSLLGADKSDSMIVLLSYEKSISSAEAMKNAAYIAEFIRDEVAKSLAPLTVSIGIGRVAFDVADIPASYKQATQAMVLGRKIFGRNRSTHFDELGIFRVIFDGPDSEEQSMFREEWIKPVVEHDRAKGTNLIETLGTYFDCNLNVQESAKKLFIHENTMRYRLNKIEGLLDAQLSSGETLLNLWTALKLHIAAETRQVEGPKKP